MKLRIIQNGTDYYKGQEWWGWCWWDVTRWRDSLEYVKEYMTNHRNSYKPDRVVEEWEEAFEQ